MRFTSRSTSVAAAALVVLMMAAGCGDSGDSSAGTTTTAAEATTTSASVDVPDGIVVGAGINDPDDSTIAVLEFMPETVSVEVGTPVEWEWSGTEPHSVTFQAEGDTRPAPGTPEEGALFGPTPPVGDFDGTSLANSGLQPLGPTEPAPFTMTFAEPGTYSYFCVIHPKMTGEVTVVAAGEDSDDPASVAERRASDQAKWLKEGRDLKAEFVAAEPVSAKNDDGTTTWTVKMGTTSEHTDILAFSPTPTQIKAGDTVKYLNDSEAPHTASFFGTGAEPINNPVDPRVAPPAPGPSPQTLSSEGFFNTGQLPPNAPAGSGPPEEARTFSFVVPTAGSYGYVCILHAPSKMVGTITAV